ncbi:MULTISPECIES: hypothetical protein [unclassified Mesorhizobium]|uniref:hypothetical protein n=1 Tax=unclassified Mesorhizobium TaxID=325217 RepID=UPI000FCB9805|nr:MULTISPECIES: hypothetical protein [unclassified Mesorhizobium]TIT78504.1 MAG: hypothetical protein E5W57_10880 [Mesorhizobium sp.]TGP26736.1 hypothetical protein EN874_003475 [Mesorhizobium sp. M1D.F.Ca.ET.231.01.1.1]TGP38693.1 hypothetical protein EN877_03475 [Mesorhizobium sp. M1D.F.Ca.ET.234.01.1.1]TGS50902.1 hypothetical protein EN827_03475 [Mesorhizobium sp. M1D.F.Ca.ET.184.01.1.1]TGS66787.1 hypothetical protein EN826_003475 [Mesorhizobium sp. M1D.F.Ca.ET.183.01.1.1]
MLFEPLNSDGEKRSAQYHAARLAMLHDRVVKRMDRVDHLADKVEHAAAVLVEATHEPANVDMSCRPLPKFQPDAV